MRTNCAAEMDIVKQSSMCEDCFFADIYVAQEQSL